MSDAVRCSCSRRAGIALIDIREGGLGDISVFLGEKSEESRFKIVMSNEERLHQSISSVKSDDGKGYGWNVPTFFTKLPFLPLEK
jgi:hypothetical protein